MAAFTVGRLFVGWLRKCWLDMGAVYQVVAMLALLLVLLLAGAKVLAADGVQSAVPRPAARVVIPDHSTRYRLAIERETGAVFGLTGSPARIAAQIHQESRFKPRAQSVYAQGLAQFTPSTAAWIAKVYPAECGRADPWDEQWSIRCAVMYDAYLIAHVRAADDCERWAMGLSAYNGGLSWVQRDQRLAVAVGANGQRWFDQVEKYSGRSAAAKAENRAYVRRILRTLEHAYIDAGWEGSAVCPRSA